MSAVSQILRLNEMCQSTRKGIVTPKWIGGIKKLLKEFHSSPLRILIAFACFCITSPLGYICEDARRVRTSNIMMCVALELSSNRALAL